MKKIGIMSMQRITNYGSFLQAYGLMKIICNLNHKVEFVDYEFEKSIINNTNKKSIIKKIIDNINLINFYKRKKIQKEFKDMYKLYIKKYLNISDNRNYYPNIDTLVIGSDEVFNCLQTYPVGYSKNLYGKGYENKNIISYAASFGHTTIEGLKEHKIDNEISLLLKKFNNISVRDKNSEKIVKELINETPHVHLDPVLVYDYTTEINNNIVPLENFIIVYAYSGRLTKQEEKYIKWLANKYEKKIVSLGFYQKIADYNLIVDPFMVLSYIKKADFVITDTFHGTVFSIKMNTKFCTIIRKSNQNKLYYLLKKMGHTMQMVNNINDIEKIYKKDICFNNSNRLLEEEKNKTLEYLKNNI